MRPAGDTLGDLLQAVHDEVARRRVRRLFERRGIDPTLVDRIVAAVASRPLEAHRGLLAHVSLRLSPVQTGTTVYVSTEAYGGTA